MSQKAEFNLILFAITQDEKKWGQKTHVQNGLSFSKGIATFS